MPLLDELKKLLIKHNIQLSKSLGQHFLVDENVYNNIINAANLSPKDHVLEIGAGLGHLTERLARECEKVITVEVDKKCLTILNDRLKIHSNITILNTDIRKLNLKEICYPNSWIVVANIPYYLSSFLLRIFIDNRNLFSSFVLMLQQEVAERLTALPATKAYGILSVLTQTFMKPELISIVPNSAFLPPPKVNSAIIKLTKKPSPLQDDTISLFFDVVKLAFAQRRKTLRNNLKGYERIQQEQLNTLEQKTGIDLTRRGETLSVSDFIALTHAIQSAVIISKSH